MVPHPLSSFLADRYDSLTEIGAGGMAVVYRARDKRHPRDVVIKVLRPELGDAVGHERFLREIDALSSLQHPHILPLIDSGKVDGMLFYVAPFVEGGSLRDLLTRGPMSIEQATQIARQIADALAYAHRHGIVHRDIKPENILMSQGHALLADFGISRGSPSASATTLTQAGASVGTPTYMSPEQAAGDSHQSDGRSDIYSLGCVLFEMLAGAPPYTGPDARTVMARHAIDSIPAIGAFRPSVPPALRAAVEKALQKVPADRFDSAADFATALGVAGVSIDSAMAAPSTTRRVPGGLRRAVVGAGLAISAVGALAVILPRLSDREAAASSLVPQQVTSVGDVVAANPVPSPDGTRLLLRRGSMLNKALWIAEVATGQLRMLTDSAPGLALGWSEDNTYVLLADSTGVWKVRIPDGERSRLIEDTQRRIWQFDGRRLSVVIQGDTLQRVVHRDLRSGTVDTVVFRARGFPAAVVLADRSTGEFLLAGGVLPDRRNVVLRLNERRLTVDTLLAESNDTRLFIGLRAASGSLLGYRVLGDSASLWRISTRSRSERLTHVATLPEELGPRAMSSDGTRLFYRKETRPGTLWEVPLGSDREVLQSQRLFSSPTLASAVVSPDGQTVARISHLGPLQFQLQVSALDGSNVRSLDTGDSTLMAPTWSHDGTHVVARFQNTTVWGLVSIDVRSGVVSRFRLGPARAMTRGSFRTVPAGHAAAVSRDGRTLFFSTFANGAERRVRSLDVMTPEARPTVVVDWTADTTRRVEGLLLSPDERSIAVGGTRISIVPLSGGQPRNILPAGPYTLAVPLHWPSADRLVYATRSPGSLGLTHIWELRVNGGAPPRLLANLTGGCGVMITVRSDGRAAYCVRTEPRSDIWMIDGLQQ